MRASTFLLSIAAAAATASSVARASVPARRRSPITPAAEQFIPAQDARVTTVGRTLLNGDGSQTFDWEGTSFAINVNGSSYVKAVINATGGILGRFICEVDGWEVASFYVGGGNGAVGTNTFLCAYDLYAVRHVRLIQSLEPTFAGANADAAFTLLGFATDGAVIAPTPRTRNIELVGDSISAGYGSRGYAGTPYGCPVDDNTSGNYYSYNWKLAEALMANIIPIAWSGKGMYVNCCDNGETMPSYYLQTLAGRAYSTDWDFARYVPDMMIINLVSPYLLPPPLLPPPLLFSHSPLRPPSGMQGTNDFGHDSVS